MGQRCIVPLAGFYIWKRTAAGYRQPFYVRLVNRPVFGVAALWDRFVTDDDDVIEGCSLVTVPSNSPAFADRQHRRTDARHPSPGQLPHLAERAVPRRPGTSLHSYPPDRMLTHAVGPHVNFLEYDDPSPHPPDRINWRVPGQAQARRGDASHGLRPTFLPVEATGNL